MQQYLASGSTGFYFNDNKSHLSLSFAYYTRDEIGANERSYSASEDRRFNERVPTEFIGDTQLDNRSLSSPWAIFDGEKLAASILAPSPWEIVSRSFLTAFVLRRGLFHEKCVMTLRFRIKA